MNPRDGAVRLCQLIKNPDVAQELKLRSEVINADVQFGWLVSNIERSLGFPKSLAVEAVEGADAVAVLLANEHVTYEVRRIFSGSTGTDPQGGLRVLQRAAAQAPQSTRTINQSADKLMQEITARNPTSAALSFSVEAHPVAPPPGQLGLSAPSAAAPPPGTTVVGVSQGLVDRPPMEGLHALPHLPDPPSNGTTPVDPSSETNDVRNAKGQFVSSSSVQEALDAGDLDALRALLG